MSSKKDCEETQLATPMEPNQHDGIDYDKGRKKYPRAIVAVDVVVFGVMPDNNELRVFVQRDKKTDDWLLPGRFLHAGRWGKSEVDQGPDSDNWTLEETRQNALVRSWPIKTTFGDEVLSSEVIYRVPQNNDIMVQLPAKSKIDRDTREKRVISVPYMTLVGIRDPLPEHLTKLSLAQWAPVSEILKTEKIKLGHDHQEILQDAYNRLFQWIRTVPIGLNVVTASVKELKDNEVGDVSTIEWNDYPFEIYSLIHLYNVILSLKNLSVDRSNLRKLLKDDRKVISVFDGSSKKGGRSKKGGDVCVFNDKYLEFKKDFTFAFNPKPRGKKKSTQPKKKTTEPKKKSTQSKKESE